MPEEVSRANPTGRLFWHRLIFVAGVTSSRERRHFDHSPSVIRSGLNPQQMENRQEAEKMKNSSILRSFNQ